MIKQVCFQAAAIQIGALYGLGPVLSNHYDAVAAFQQKIWALIGRNETQARDIFDIYLLLGYEVNSSKIPQDLKEKLTIASTNLSSINFADFKSQVVSYLAPEFQAQYNDEASWNEIQMRVYMVIEAIQQ